MARRNKDSFGLVWEGLDQFVNELKGMEKNLIPNVKKGMEKYGSLAEEGTKALVHRDHGDLEASIVFEKPKIEGDAIVVEGGSNLVYALRRHEERPRPGVHDKYDNGVKEIGYYVDGRGRRTRQKPSWRGLHPGRKFMERTIAVTNIDFNRFMDEALQKTLEGKRYL